MIHDSLQEAYYIIKTIKHAGHEAFFVGGAVRDLILSRQLKDIDIATSATPEEIALLFDKVIPVGIDHGTVIVRYKGTSYEVTTFRTGESSSLNKRTIYEDLKYRDFTMNAIAMDDQGEMIDLFRGKEDILNKTIRTVGMSKDRFIEDPLRIIRAFRFMSQFGFTIEEKTFQAMYENKDLLTRISIERIIVEYEKLISGKYVRETIQCIFEHDFASDLPIFSNNVHLSNDFINDLEPLNHLSSLLAYIGFLNKNKVVEYNSALKLSNQMKRDAQNLLSCLLLYKNKQLENWTIYQLDQRLLGDYLSLINMIFHKKHSIEELIQIHKELPIHSRKDLQINGHDLLQIFVDRKPGPWLQEMIEVLEYKVVQNKLQNNKYILKEWIQCNPPEIN